MVLIYESIIEWQDRPQEEDNEDAKIADDDVPEEEEENPRQHESEKRLDDFKDEDEPIKYDEPEEDQQNDD